MADFTTGGAKAQNADTFIGKKLGKYEVKEKLGQGAMGIVLKVWDTLEEVYKAIKMVPPEVAFDKLSFNQLKKEVNPNVIKVMGLEEYQGLYFILMEYIEGETLADKLADVLEGKLDENIVLEYMDQICLGLKEAHKNGVIHLDLKPQNIMVKKNGEIKILDFSISHQITKSMTMLTGQNLSTGTLPYMAPEQLSKKHGRINEQTDVWGLGAVIYHLVSGEVPFEDRNQILDPEEAPYELEGVSDEIIMIISGCLTKDRKERFGNINEVLKKSGVVVNESMNKVENEVIEIKNIEKDSNLNKIETGDLSISTNEDCLISINNKTYKTSERYIFINNLKYGEIQIKAESDKSIAVNTYKIEKKLTKLTIELKQKMAGLYAKSKIGKYEIIFNGKNYQCPELIENIPVGKYDIEIIYKSEHYTEKINLSDNSTVDYELTKNKIDGFKKTIEKKILEESLYIDSADGEIIENINNYKSEKQVHIIVKKKNFYESDWNKNGRFKNDYEVETIDKDITVIDRVTCLMWQQAGSNEEMSLIKAIEWIKKLNEIEYAGYNDWRLPSIEEVATLIENKRNSLFLGLFISDIFDKKQRWILTGDLFSSDKAWIVDFNYGKINWSNIDIRYNVRAVRFWQQSFEERVEN